MTSFLKSFFTFLNRDFTGRTWERSQNHPYFGEMIYFGDKNLSKCYWEGEVSHKSLTAPIGVTMAGTPAGPTPTEEEFCRNIISDLDALFEKCRTAFEPIFVQWAKEKMPANWRESFKLDGFQIPKDGNLNSPWEVCYFAEPTGHYFIAQFENGKVKNVAVDG